MLAATLLTVAAFISGALPQGIFMINTPGGVVQCTPTQITWDNGVGPFTLLFQTPDANGIIQQTYAGIPNSPFVWTTNITGPIQLGMTIRDSQGNPAQSGPFVVNSSPDTSCLAGNAPSSSGSTAAPSSAALSSTSGSSAPSSASGSSTSSSTTLSGPSTSRASSTTSSGTSSRSTSSTTSTSPSSLSSNTPSPTNSPPPINSPSPTSTSSPTSTPSPTNTSNAAMSKSDAADVVTLVGLIIAGLIV